MRTLTERGVTAHHVQSAEDLDVDWFDGCRAVGLTAGTSTLDATIGAVETELLRIGAGCGSTTGRLTADGRRPAESRAAG